MRGVYVVMRQLLGGKVYLAELGISNGVEARFSHITTTNMDLAIPLTWYQADTIVGLLRTIYPTDLWYFEEKKNVCGKVCSGVACTMAKGSKCPDCGPSLIDCGPGGVFAL